eukprot:scaffold23127_cov112-Isochrysis_galbana.AAC.1
MIPIPTFLRCQSALMRPARTAEPRRNCLPPCSSFPPTRLAALEMGRGARAAWAAAGDPPAPAGKATAGVTGSSAERRTTSRDRAPRFAPS